MTEHTRLPWHASQKSVYVSDIHNRTIAEVHRDGDERIANAAFIVEAVNSHYQLKADLARARKALEEMVNTFEPFSLRPIGSPNSAIRKGQEHQIDVHKRARAALAEIAH